MNGTSSATVASAARARAVAHVDHGRRRGEFGDDLPAGAAGREELLGLADDQDLADLRLAGGDHGEDGVALGAAGQPERGVFDVAAAVDPAVGAEDGRAHAEIRIGGVGFFARLPGRSQQFISYIGHVRPAR